MVFFPLLTFFGTSLFVFPTVANGGTYTDNDNLTYSGLASVVAVNIVIVCYMVYALCLDPDRDLYDDEEESGEEEKVDKKSDEASDAPKKKKVKKTKKNKKDD